MRYIGSTPPPRLPLRTPARRSLRGEILEARSPAADVVALDYIKTDEAWDDARGLMHVSRSAVRVTMPLQSLVASRGRILAAPAHRRPAWLAPALAILASASLLLLSITGLPDAPPQAPDSAVDIELGPPSPLRQPAPPPPAAKPMPVPAAALEPAPLAADPNPAQPAAADQTEADPSPAKLIALQSVSQAFAKALESGTAEPWQENGLSGYVVLGPSALAGESVCRNLAIWLDREGGTGEVADARKCLGADGKWIDS